ncbi:MAG: M1 family metallopeptidase [Flavobacteriales bacterium]|jgi:aminopeptidase N|nr:M1 family metallopeptidase [Flavobacteriales bacterium]
MHRLSLCIIVLALAWQAPAQQYDPRHQPDTYRSAANPEYWGNRPPYPGYWQQDVYHHIHARLDDRRDLVEGRMTLLYHNNSPDTLHHVFFHLYQEAYSAGSHLEKLRGRPMPEGAGTVVRTLSADGTALRTEQDNTVLKAWLPAPLPPGGSVTFLCEFTTHWAMGLGRRMKLFNAWGQKHYDGVHWYPRIAVYDRRRGWDVQQHLGHEFYGEYGTFDVALDLPHEYIVEATGWLQNRDEVLPPELRAKLDLANFKDKPWNEPPSVIIPPDGTTRKVWRYHAENVHDFAFTADPTYRIGEAEWNLPAGQAGGVLCVAVAQEPHASGWQNAASFTADLVRVFSEDFGMYAYPKMVVADARDGMEYPMLTLDGGRDPGYRDLLAHEVGHNWFFGMVGSNETYRAFMDEGFTQFLTAWALERIDGDTLVTDPPRSRYEARYRPAPLAREHAVYRGYMPDAVRDEVPPINVHSDEFGHVTGLRGGYRHVYYKTAAMLYNLQYVLGDSLFLEAMRHYVDQWRTCHPYPEDMRQSFVDRTGAELDWFFDQWIESDKRVDYAVRRVKGRHRDDGQEIHLRRRGAMQMPLDVRVTAKDGTMHDFHVPNTWFVKRTQATVLPRWTGFDELNRDHVLQVDIPSGIEQVTIDPSGRLADVHPMNDHMRMPMSITLDHHLPRPPDRRVYEGFVRPDIWWNGYDGVKAGVHFNSSYMQYKHRLHATAWLNTGMGQHLPPGNPALLADSIPGNTDTGFDPVSFNLRYENGTEKLLKGSAVFAEARMLDGLERYRAGMRWQLPDRRTEAEVALMYMVRRDSSDLTYLLYPGLWELDRVNGAFDAGVRRSFAHGRGGGHLHAQLRSSAVGAESTYAQLRLTAVNTMRMGGLELRTRLFGQYGTGATPKESALYLAGASPEEMMEDKYVRSVGFVPYEWLGMGAVPGHFHHGGGLGLRGYAGYLAPEIDADGHMHLTYMGNTGLSASGELDLDGLVKWRPGKLASVLHLDVYLFGDVGVMGYRTAATDRDRLRLAAARADAGAGAALTIKRFGRFTGIKPLTVRFDMPFVLSAVPEAEADHVGFRYVVGVGRSF